MKLAHANVLVTGSEGFIGSHLVEALVRTNANVTALVQYNSFGRLGWLERIEPHIRSAIRIVMGDVRDPGSMTTAIPGQAVIFHLAALIAIPYSYVAPRSYVDTNVTGTLNVLEAALKSRVERIIHTSTSEVYGSAIRTPIDEAHPLSAQSPYAATKIAADQLALSYHRSFQLPVTIVRPFNTYGPRQSTRAVIPTVITQLAAGARSLRLGSLEPRRDFTYVTDTAQGFIDLAQSDEALGEATNLGSEYTISIGALAKLIVQLMGAEAEIESEKVRVRPEASEVDLLLADTSKAKKISAWNPQYSGRSGLEKGLKRTIAWFRDPANQVQDGQEYQL